MRSKLGLITPILAALALIMGTITACSSNAPSKDGSRSVNTPQPMSSEALALQQAFNELSVGDTSTKVLRLLGPPTMDHPDHGEGRVWQYQHVRIKAGAVIVVFNGFVTLNAQGNVTKIQQTKP